MLTIEITIKRDESTILTTSFDAFKAYSHEFDTPIHEDNSILHGFTFLPLISGEKRIKDFHIVFSETN